MATPAENSPLFLAFQPPIIEPGRGWIEPLPEIAGGGSPAAAAAMLVGLALGTLAQFIPPPRAKKPRAEQDREDTKRVIKVTEVHKALEASITTAQLSLLVGRIMLALLKGQAHAEPTWMTAADVTAESSDILPPLIDHCMEEVRKRVLQQDNKRERGNWEAKSRGDFEPVVLRIGGRMHPR